METVNRLFVYLSSLVTAMSNPAESLTPARLGRGRAVGMIEYVILAVVVLGFGVIFRDQLGGAIDTLITAISNYLGGEVPQ